MASKLTQRAVDGLTPDPDRDVFLWDGGDGAVKGFGVRAKPSGAKSFMVQYRNEHRQSKRFTVGSASVLKVEAARAKAKKLLAGVIDGEDPAAQKAAKAKPDGFKGVAEAFIADHVKVHTRDWRNTERLLNSHVIARWGSRPVNSIQRADVRELLREVKATAGPIAANRTLAHVRKLFGWACTQDILEASPAIGIEAPSPENRKDRVLADREIRIVWQACDRVPVFGPWAKFLLATGQRRTEAAGMRREDVDATDRAAAQWSIPAEDYKGRRLHVVPLTALALDILAEAERQAAKVKEDGMTKPSPFVFTTRGKQPISGYSKAKATLDAEVATVIAELPEDQRFEIGSWTYHDLRRTAATNMTRYGASRFIVDRVLGHVDRSVGGIYDRHEYLAEKRDALDRWARALANIVTPPGANVVAMPKRRARQ